MATILTKTIISNAMGAVDTYKESAKALYGELDDIIKALTGNNFNGDASDGYLVFYQQKVVPALTENLTAEANSLMAGIKNMLESIQTQLLDTVDPQLKSYNENPNAAG